MSQPFKYGIDMPREIRSSEEFEKLAESAHECRVVRGPDFVKLKLRTSDYLYVYKTNEENAEDLLKSLKEVEVVEITPKKEKGKKEKEEEKKEEKDEEKE